MNKNLVLLLIADFISSFGSSATSMAMLLEVYSRTDNLMLPSLFAMVTLLPKVIITPFVSRIRLRGSFRSIFICQELICGGLVALLLLNDGLAAIFALCGLFGVIFFVLECYRAEFLKVISDESNIHRYQGISRNVNILVLVIGPLVAGAVMTSWGVRYIYTIDIISYLLAAFVIKFIDKAFRPVNGMQGMTRLRASLKITDKSYIYIGSILIVFIGGATSMLTLAYINDILRLNPFMYSLLMASNSAGGFIGNMAGAIEPIKKRLRRISLSSMFLVGCLLLSVLFRPAFIPMIGILFISGVLSALTMLYFATEIFMRYNQNEIREKYAYFSSAIDIAAAASKPFSGVVERLAGVVYSIAGMGLLFMIFTPIEWRLMGAGKV